MSAPTLRLTRLHVRGLRALRSLDLPEDGIDWGGSIPDVVVIGGPNGSGKSTLLWLIAELVARIANEASVALAREADEAWLEVRIGDGTAEPVRIASLIGDPRTPHEQGWGNCVWSHGGGTSWNGDAGTMIRQIQDHGFARTAFPSLIYLPSETRDLRVPDTTYKAPGRRVRSARFFEQWRPPTKWEDSLEAYLYALRWADLNAGALDPAAGPRAFDAFADEVRDFFEGQRELRWDADGALWVETAWGSRHAISEFGTGERQVLVMLCELRQLWRPGSLVLIDEPELHLHLAWQMRFLERLLALRADRGGQVILATQSGDIFRAAPECSRLLIGGSAA